MPSAQTVLDLARTELGYVEQGGPHGNDGNITKFWTWFDDLAGTHDQGLSWCATFQLWLDFHAGLALEPDWVHFIYCPSWEGFLRRSGRLVALDQAVAGDYLFFHFPGEANEANHIGRLVSIDRAARTVTCIEGNTAKGTRGSQSNGGGVYQRTRAFSVVRSVGRPLYQGDDMPLSDEDIKKVATAVAGYPEIPDVVNLGALNSKLVALATKVDKIAVGGVDLDALAKKVADVLADRLKA